MPKLQHKHRWHVDLTPDGVSIHCLERCGANWSLGELEAALNAVESFPIQDALQVLWDLEHAAGIAIGDEYDALQDYASELEP